MKDMNTLDSETAGQISDRLKSLFESARRFRAQRRRTLVRSIKAGRDPRESQLELGLRWES